LAEPWFLNYRAIGTGETPVIRQRSSSLSSAHG